MRKKKQKKSWQIRAKPLRNNKIKVTGSHGINVKENKNGNKHIKFEPIPYARKQAQKF